MSNIIWKKPDSSVVVTFMADETPPYEHATYLQESGIVPADWEAVSFSWENFPTEPQSSWRWDGLQIIVDTDALHRYKYRYTVSPFQIRSALNQLNLRDQVEQAVSTAGQDLKDAWAYKQKFNRFDADILEIQSLLSLSDVEIDSIFDLADTIGR